MTIVRERDSRIVVYMFDDSIEVSIGDRMVAGDIVALDIRSGTHEAVSADAPELFVGGALRYDGEWSIHNRAALDEHLTMLRKMETPKSISARQARLVLLGAGLLDEIEALLSTHRAYQIEWEYATEFDRDHPLIVEIATQLGLSDEEVDNLFIAGGTL